MRVSRNSDGADQCKEDNQEEEIRQKTTGVLMQWGRALLVAGFIGTLHKLLAGGERAGLTSVTISWWTRLISVDSMSRDGVRFQSRERLSAREKSEGEVVRVKDGQAGRDRE